MNKELESNLLILYHLITLINNRKRNFHFINSKYNTIDQIDYTNDLVNYGEIQTELLKSQVIDLCSFNDEWKRFIGKGTELELKIRDFRKSQKVELKKLKVKKLVDFRNSYIAHNLRDKKNEFIFLKKDNSFKNTIVFQGVDAVLKVGEKLLNDFDQELKYASEKHNLLYEKIIFI